MTKSKIDTTERSESVSKPFLTTLELMAKDWPSPEWIIEGILPEQGICILAGNPGDGKTWVALHVALCVSIGTPVFDHFPTKATNVLIVDEESGERGLKERKCPDSREDDKDGQRPGAGDIAEPRELGEADEIGRAHV